MVYCSLVESVIAYGLIVWGSACKTYFKKLEIAQKWVTKIMLFKKKTFPTNLVYSLSEIFTVEPLYLKSVVRFMLNSSYYKKNISHNRNTRSEALQNVLLNRTTTSAYQRYIFCTGPKVYNALPQELRTKPYKKIKKSIVKWIAESNYSIVFLE